MSDFLFRVNKAEPYEISKESELEVLRSQLDLYSLKSVKLDAWLHAAIQVPFRFVES